MPELMFQSLFCWIGLFDSPEKRRVGEGALEVSILVLLDRSLRLTSSCSENSWASPSFNPCFVGSVSSTQYGGKPGRILERFQSLFCWIGLFDWPGTVLLHLVE